MVKVLVGSEKLKQGKEKAIRSGKNDTAHPGYP